MDVAHMCVRTADVLTTVWIFGLGHPFDTIKTKMQAQTQYMGKQSMVSTFVNVFKKEGVRGWYRG